MGASNHPLDQATAQVGPGFAKPPECELAVHVPKTQDSPNSDMVATNLVDQNVLYITYDGLTDPLGQSQILPYLCRLSEKGLRYSIISCEKQSRFKSAGATIQSLCDNHNIRWHPLPYNKSPPILSTWFDVRQMTKLARKLCRDRHFEVLHCRSYIPALIGQRIKKKTGTPWIFDMRGFWADERVDANAWNLANPIYRFIYAYFKRKESEFVSESDAIVSLTESAAKEIDTWTQGSSQQKLFTIPCCVDLKHFDPGRFSPRDRAATRNRIGCRTDDIVCTYVGSIGTWYLTAEMLSFFRELKSSKPTAKALFVTKDPTNEIRDLARRSGIPDADLILIAAEREQMPEFLFASDLCFFFIRPSYSKTASSPTKLGEMLGMGKPVICNSGIGDLDTLFQSNEVGDTVDVYQPNSWTATIERFDSILATDKCKLRQTARREFDLESGIDRYLEVYNYVAHQEVG